MKRALLLVATASFAVGAAGCNNDNDVSMSIVQMEAVTRANSCIATAMAGTTALSRSRGVLDLNNVTTQGYEAVPVVRNNLLSDINNAGPQPGVEFNSIQLTGANVTLKTVTGAPMALPNGQSSFFYNAAGGRIDPGGTAAMFVEVIPASMAKSLASQVPAGGVLTIVTELQPVGEHQYDQIIGGRVPFAVDLCVGCLTAPVVPCPIAAGAADPCFPQQDEPTVCCQDAATNNVLCGSNAPTM